MGSPPPDRLRSTSQADSLKLPALCAASLCVPVIPVGASVRLEPALRHRQSTRDEREAHSGLATPDHRVGLLGCNGLGSATPVANQSAWSIASTGSSDSHY